MFILHNLWIEGDEVLQTPWGALEDEFSDNSKPEDKTIAEDENRYPILTLLWKVEMEILFFCK